MLIENQNITIINVGTLNKESDFRLVNCIIDTIDLLAVFELETHFVIENCVVNNLQIHSCWFVNGFVLKNSIVKNGIDYQMGGHNRSPISFEGNVFVEFLNFFDCHFEDLVTLKNNVFMKGTNLLGNRDEGFRNTFKSGWFIENNVGAVDLNKVW